MSKKLNVWKFSPQKAVSIITIQCRLVASETTRRHLWTLMAQRNTPLVNELLCQMSQHPDLVTWQQKGKLPTGIVKKLCQPLKTDLRFENQPSRFYMSAIALVEYIYKSWLQLQHRRQRQLDGQIHWLFMLKSDETLIQESQCSLETLRDRAQTILSQLDGDHAKQLFQKYDKAKDTLTRSAICYLLKNRQCLPKKAEDPQKLAQRRRKVEIKIERLRNQLESRIPKGRDITGEAWLNTLFTAANTVPQNAQEAKTWQDILLTRAKSVPYPVAYETNEDLTWSKNEKNRLCVRFNGMSDYSFQIYCDQRQLKWFERFFQDQETKKQSKNQHSSALFTLRSARILWQEHQGKDQPWQKHRLILYCSLDTRFWTAEGTEQIRQEKAAKVTKTLDNLQAKDDLTPQQQAFLRRQNSTLERINTPFPRPNQATYQGQPNILVGVALGLEKPATVAVVDINKSRAIAYRSIKQLLGSNYKLLNRQRRQKQRNSHKRHKAQKQNMPNQFGDSNMGEYIDCLLAKAIISVAQKYQASSIVLPKLGDLRELVQSEVKVRAEAKIPGYLEGQEQYAKQYRVNVHQWSYGRLIDHIHQQASKVGIAIEQGQQPTRASPENQARELAVTAYQSRTQN